MVAVSSTRLSYDRVAERYAAEIGFELGGKPLDRALLAAFAEIVGDGPVLDAGCGPGHVAAHLATTGVATLGTDLSPGMCALAARSTSLPFVVGDMTRLPMRSGSLAGIVSFYAVIHLDEDQRRAAYVDFARALRPGGVALDRLSHERHRRHRR